jgi:hypothetical protein
MEYSYFKDRNSGSKEGKQLARGLNGKLLTESGPDSGFLTHLTWSVGEGNLLKTLLRKVVFEWGDWGGEGRL